MVATNPALQSVIDKYNADVAKTLGSFDWTPVHALAEELLDCWKTGRQVFFCGNGGSAANAIHMANDFLYGISKKFGSGLNCHALSANPAVMTCLANDEGYNNIFSYQLGIMARENDVLIVLSGSGNSANILEALKTAKEKNVKSYGILGYSGGKAKDMVDTALHFAIDDMEIAEDLQMIVAHIVKRHMWSLKETIDAGRSSTDKPLLKTA